MEERRQINRTVFHSKSVIVICDTEQKIYAEVENLSPLGMGVHVPADSPELLHKDIIIITETLIMYALVNRVDRREDGSALSGIEAKRFTNDVLQYLFEHIGQSDIDA